MPVFRQAILLSAAVLCVSMLIVQQAYADERNTDHDNDGIPTEQELIVHGTNPSLYDTDGDGFSDGEEIRHGYSPLSKAKRLEDSDSDADGLTDYLEIGFGTHVLKKDTDSDGYSDGDEVKNGYDPRNNGGAKLTKHIEVNLTKQRLSYYLGSVRLGEIGISSGRWNWPTPVGTFTIINKSPKAWSKLAGLWMPYWMGFAGGKFGIHDLPIWPNGKKEGENHIGKPVSHGCIRVSSAHAKKLYQWTPIGTKLIIKK